MADLYANQKNDKIYDIDKAIDIYKECIETNADSMAMFKLGSLYLKGKGVEKDIELGLHYLNNAIDGGNSFAKVTLADFYADSTHSRYNITKAIQLYKDCIKNDSDSYSMSRLGSIYLFGHGVDKDEALGLKYLNDAVANGNDHALARLAKEPVPQEVLKTYGLKSLSFGREYLIPKPSDPRLLAVVATAVARAAIESGVARREIEDWDAYAASLTRRVKNTK